MNETIGRLAGIAKRHRMMLQWAAVLLLAISAAIFGRFRGPIKELNLCDEAGRTTFLLLFAGLFAAVMGWLVTRKRLDWPHFWYAAAIVLAALFTRGALFNQVTGDYQNHLRVWVEAFREQGFHAVTQEIGDYNLPYQYILAGVAALPLPDLYLIKLVSVVFDFALALMAMALVERFMRPRLGLPVFAILLLLPTAWFNSAYWAQCDALYVFFIVACLYAMLADRPLLSVALLAVAFSFKIQTIFFFPMVLFALLKGKYKLRHLLIFPAVYLLLLAPALLAGRGLVSALSIYLRQTNQYGYRLTLGAPNIYQFWPGGMASYRPEWHTILSYLPDANPEAWNGWFTLQSAGMLNSALVPFAGAVVLSFVLYLHSRRKYIAQEQVWRLALAFALLLPLVLPKMHDRYFFLAEMFAVLYAVRYPKRWYVAALVCFGSFQSYMPFLARERPVDMRIAAAMIIAAMVVVLMDLVKEMRAAQAAVSDVSV
jgi:Gpi18-like mannosyltransferase